MLLALIHAFLTHHQRCLWIGVELHPVLFLQSSELWQTKRHTVSPYVRLSMDWFCGEVKWTWFG